MNEARAFAKSLQLSVQTVCGHYKWIYLRISTKELDQLSVEKQSSAAKARDQYQHEIEVE